MWACIFNLSIIIEERKSKKYAKILPLPLLPIQFVSGHERI